MGRRGTRRARVMVTAGAAVAFAGSVLRVVTVDPHTPPRTVSLAEPRAERVDPLAPIRRCPTRLPGGFRIVGGYPAGEDGRYNPQNIALFMQSVLRNVGYSRAERACLGRLAADALLARADRRGGALLFGYPFAYEYGRLGTIRPVWYSALSQGTVLTMLDLVYRITGDGRYERAAHAAFESLHTGAFVTRVGSGTWLQEYPTSEPSYVLNGHVFAALAARWWGMRSGDTRGAMLFDRAMRALERLLPLFDVRTPDGEVSSYDLTRRLPAAPLRVSPSVVVRHAEIEDERSHVLGSLPLGPKAVVPRYPRSVLRFPRVYLRIEYTGSGVLQAVQEGEWVTIAALPRSGRATIVVPDHLQGRMLSISYHRMHVRLLKHLYQITGRSAFREWARRWRPLALT